MGWDSLPHDLLVKIFSKLGIEEILVGAPLACRAWYAASLDPSLYRVLDLHDWNRIVCRITGGDPKKRCRPRDLLKIVVSCGGEAIERIRFMEGLVSESDIIFIAHRCPNLKVLYLQSPIMISTEVFCYAISKWRNLQGMEVDEHSQAGNLGSNPFVLQKLYFLLGNGRLLIYLATNIVHYLPKLKSLDLSNTMPTQDAMLVILKGSEELESTQRWLQGFAAGFGSKWYDKRFLSYWSWNRHNMKMRILCVLGRKTWRWIVIQSLGLVVLDGIYYLGFLNS